LRRKAGELLRLALLLVEQVVVLAVTRARNALARWKVVSCSKRSKA
jgi:hypothetical protein